MDKVTSFIREHKVASVVVLFILLTLALIPTSEPTSNPNATEQAPVEQAEVKTTDYRIVSEEDISYAGCRRVVYRVLLDGDEEQSVIDSTLREAVVAKKDAWDNITFFAYDYSDEEMDVTKLAYTEGVAEHSTCE